MAPDAGHLGRRLRRPGAPPRSANERTGGAPVGEILTGSRLPRLLAGVAVGFALGCAGALLQSVTRNALASPDTLAVTAGAYFTLTLVAAFGLTVPLWASGAVAFAGGLVAAALVLLLAGRAAGTTGTRLILAGSATAMALDAADRRCCSSCSTRTPPASSPGAAARSPS